MKNFIYGLFFSFCVNCIIAQPNFQWVERTQSIANNIMNDPAGNVITIGSFSVTTDFDPGPGVYTLSPAGNSDVFALKVDAAGNFIWAVKLNTSMDALATGMNIDASGNIYVTGGVSGTPSYDVFVWKLNASGTTVWMKTMGGSFNDNGIDIDVDPSGNVYTAGIFSSSNADFDPGPGTFTLSGSAEGFISKLDASGNFVWAKAITRTASPFPLIIWSLRTDNSGDVYYGGEFAGTADFDPNASTYTLAAGGSSRDGFIAKLNSSGNFAWAGSMTSLRDDGVTKMRKGTNEIYVLGRFDSIADLNPGPGTYTLDASVNGANYIMKLNSAGNMLWVKPMFPEASQLALDASENIYTSGFFYPTTDFDPGPGTFTMSPSTVGGGSFISKLDSAANFKWAIQLQDTGYKGFGAMAIDLSNNFYVIGQFLGKVDFDPGVTTYTLVASGANYESFILKLNNTSVGMKEYSSSGSVSVYPNPTNGQVNIILDKESESVKMKVIDITGSVINEKVMTQTKELKIDMAEFASGIYLLQIDLDEQTFRAKIIKN